MNISRKKLLLIFFTLFTIIVLFFGLLLIQQSGTFKKFFSDNLNTASTTTMEQSGSFLDDEDTEAPGDSSVDDTAIPTSEVTLFEYVKVKESCGIHYTDADCVVVRSGPGTEFPIVTQLRNNIVLRIDGKVENEDHTWYKIVFYETLLYPERIHGDWYIAADYVDILLDEGDKTIWEDGSATTSKRIVVDVTLQKLYAYDGDTLFMEASISTGLLLSPTPRGTFTVFKKMPSRYMQGPLPGYTDIYDLPGVPWNLYFTHEGAVIHGTYWHDSFGSRYSHGCVNVSPDDARKLYTWAVLGTKVVVQE